jgi:Fic family protein
VTDFDPKKPHNELPKLPPPADLIESNEILKKCINARVALAELKQAAELIPNAAVLVNALPLLEAQASSEIENIARRRCVTGRRCSRVPRWCAGAC